MARVYLSADGDPCLDLLTFELAPAFRPLATAELPGLLPDVGGLTDPGAVRLLYWDGSGLAWAEVGTGLDLSAGVLTATGGGSTDWADLTGVPVLVDDLAALTDPAADRLLYWDDGSGLLAWATVGSGLDLTAGVLTATGGGSSPGGSSGDVQYNDGAGGFAGDGRLNWSAGGGQLVVADAGTGLSFSVLGTFVARADRSALYAYLCSSDNAAGFGDGTRLTNVCDGSAAVYATDGTRTIRLCYGSDGIYADDGSAQQVAILSGGFTVDVISGEVSVLGTSGNTYRWGTGVGAPTPQGLISLPLNAYGGGTINNLLGDPDTWLLVNVNGSLYKVPAYT